MSIVTIWSVFLNPVTYFSGSEPTMANHTLGYAAVLNITITIEIVYELDLSRCKW